MFRAQTPDMGHSNARGPQTKLSLLGAQDAGHDESVRIAGEAPRSRLLRLSDFPNLSNEDVGNLIEAVKRPSPKGVSWIWLGDEEGLTQADLHRLRDFLSAVFKEYVEVYLGNGRLTFGFRHYHELTGLAVAAEDVLSIRAPIVARVTIDDVPPRMGLENGENPGPSASDAKRV